MDFLDGDYDPLFDLDHDGVIDVGEEAFRQDTLYGEEHSEPEEEEALEDELLMAGINPQELSEMDEDEAREVLEDLGLDPNDFDI